MIITKEFFSFYLYTQQGGESCLVLRLSLMYKLTMSHDGSEVKLQYIKNSKVNAKLHHVKINSK